ncbi:hypothetical protein KU306_11690 [Haloferax larsenii]|uniref:Lycopene cyclase domain-containing protein n=1 Tax=Haloferax larsenii TaxID=302484 RepID=A0ABY5RB40_HALLR|nr:hypothetical protein [Haloferax larsenii]ELZ82201.1 hypothetical protein C455_03289 [Haloferax larsenii JCM 13917]UVE49571.1 hypothetical protein KU306_11690 [Haloferax larsenii]
MTPDTGDASMSRRLWRVAVAPETIVAFAVLALAWLLGFVGALPKEVWVVDFPALAVAFFLDTLAYNEFGVRANTVFYPALALVGYLEAMVVGAVIRLLR